MVGCLGFNGIFNTSRLCHAVQHTVDQSQARESWEGCGTNGIWHKILGRYALLGSLAVVCVAAAIKPASGHTARRESR